MSKCNIFCKRKIRQIGTRYFECECCTYGDYRTLYKAGEQ